MLSKLDSEKRKLIQDKCQMILGNLLREEDNKYCVDCDAKGPRWASWNLGIFLCIRCAGIHRNLGVHISKVKSVNLDTWTPEQVACLQQMGNSQARAVYEANLPKHFRRPQFDSSLEAFIRAKYEHKRYIAKEWVPPPAPPPAFDIEEEKRREKERRIMTKSKLGPAIELNSVPQNPTAVPRPHSTGLHSFAMQETPKPVKQVPDSVDLLSLGDTSLNTDNNLFEADFFNQMASSDANSKMTKESILSLYAANTVQMPAAQQIGPVYGIPGGMYIGQQGYSQVGMTGFPSIPVQGIHPCTVSQGITTQPNLWIGGGDESLQLAHGMGQVTHQMANLQLTGQAWNMGVSTGSANATSMVLGSNPSSTGVTTPSNSQNNQFLNNLWQ